MKRFLLIVLAIALAWWLIWWLACSGPAQDEAMAAGIPVSFYAQPADEADHFHAMDGGEQFTPAEIRGRNTWMVWTGGNEAFWDWLSNHSFGTHDLLKVVSSYPCSSDQESRAAKRENDLAADETYMGAYGEGGYAAPPGYDPEEAKMSYATAADGYYSACADTMWPAPGKPTYRYYTRDTRFCYLGLVNEPGMEKPSEPDQWGLCLDQPEAGHEDPFPEEVYGRPSGILGLRIFDNPNFDDKAQRKWRQAMERDGYYLDPDFYLDNKLVRPYRVGMACSFCHVSPHPLHPPDDPENPEYANLSGTIGAQYFWFGRILGSNVTSDNFVWYLLDAQRPGAVDTSFVPADNLLNPRAMNAIFDVPARLKIAERIGVETQNGGALDLPEVQTHLNDGGDSATFGVPHVLWDGADSVGVDAALTRVYINIGEYHQEWIRHIDPIVGAFPQSPITVEAAQENSVFWNATQERAEDLKHYLIRAGYRMPLATALANQAAAMAQGEGEEGDGGTDGGGAPAMAASYGGGDGGGDEGGEDGAMSALDQGKVVFAETCARCHSSKLPEKLQADGDDRPALDEPGCIGGEYDDCWASYWEYTETDEFKQAMTDMVMQPGFLEDNYLSTDARIPVTVLGTEVCSSMASNAVGGHVWNDFASQSYRDLPGMGTLELWEPVQDKMVSFETWAGGRGYQRVPSLISIWATAPLLHNNEIGHFTGDPSIEGRLAAFDDAIRQLLWPETREKYVHRTDRTSDVKVSPQVLPWFVRPFAGALTEFDPILGTDVIKIGPVPKGTPVNLIANINADRAEPKVSIWTLLGIAKDVKKRLKEVARETEGMADGPEKDKVIQDVMRQLVPDLLSVTNCPDFWVNRGHEFGAERTDEEKEALIEYLKTL